MAHPKRARFYLDDGTRRRAQAGEHNFITKVTSVLHASGFDVLFHPNTLAERLKATTRRGYALCQMTPPPNDRAVTFRRVYHYPFWQIQKSDKRWEWDVAQADFDVSTCPEKEAQRFFGFWQKRIAGPLLGHVEDDGFVYVPLQGRLLDHRSFQSCTPLEMLAQVRAACPRHKIIATLHPKENYSQAELAALEQMAAADTDLTVQAGGRDTLLPRCSFVVTMNSSVAFDAMFFGKPAILFGKADFHHLVLDGQDADAFRKVHTHRPNYAAYIWWVWQHMAVNAGHESAEAKIAAKLKTAGWPVE
ncbi:hypothetical protein [Tateyamaria sp. ANG-S1]|uniref:capsular polysaccharide export protein, LipB/KpsS family n=1 Tax=Tateyamaria sp. ANG-S1 TaxID=1577905 RepID=UPI00057D0143|nr:hypothetical protein [Tateyamaria sp. ANG-S1]KIC49777.1 hypothetical protein RA29_09020 [Tateyamaria sp. ANG-S1]